MLERAVQTGVPQQYRKDSDTLLRYAIQYGSKEHGCFVCQQDCSEKLRINFHQIYVSMGTGQKTIDQILHVFWGHLQMFRYVL